MANLIEILANWGQRMSKARKWINEQGSVPGAGTPPELLGGPFTPATAAEKETYANKQTVQQRIVQQRKLVADTAATRMDQRMRDEYERLQLNDPVYWAHLVSKNPSLKQYEIPQRGKGK